MHPARRLILLASAVGAVLLAIFQPHQVTVTRAEPTPGGIRLMGATCATRARVFTDLTGPIVGRALPKGMELSVWNAGRDGARIVASGTWLLLLTVLAASAVGAHRRAGAGRQALIAIIAMGTAFAALDYSFPALADRLDGSPGYSCREVLEGGRG